MIRITPIILLIALFKHTTAQDIIVTRDGNEVLSKIIEITSNSIKYRDFNFQDGPIRNVPTTDVFMIIYENGHRESFMTTSDSATTRVNDEHPISDKKKNDFTLSTGAGNSFGGVGVRAQYRLGLNQKFGVHYGIGYFRNAPIMLAIGGKYFPYKNLYINAQFGHIGYEEKNYSQSWRDDISHRLHGPSLLIGGDFNWGSTVGYGFGVGASYRVNTRSYQTPTLAFAFDLGLNITFGYQRKQ